MHTLRVFSVNSVTKLGFCGCRDMVTKSTNETKRRVSKKEECGEEGGFDCFPNHQPPCGLMLFLLVGPIAVGPT
jgi:hypothetical protein